MIREVKEEVGLDINKENLDFVHVISRKSGPYEYIDLFFVTTIWNGNPQNLEPQKHEEIKWVSIDNLPKNMILEVRAAIENYKNGNFFSEFGWN